MEFTRRKLPKEAASTLRSCAIQSVQPYAPMLAPVYVLMQRNEKFVSVKAPLDFFVPEELERLHSFESFFFPEFVESVLPFQKTARAVRALLEWQPEGEGKLPPAPFELADAVLKLLGPLWSSSPGLSIEPFFTAVFGNELCTPLPSDMLLKAREQSVERYDHGILLSGWAVFLALHLGYSHTGLLSRLRYRIFDHVMKGTQVPEFHGAMTELHEIEYVARLSLEEAKQNIKIEASYFETLPARVAQKLVSRISRVRNELAETGAAVPSIFGTGGFVDV